MKTKKLIVTAVAALSLAGGIKALADTATPPEGGNWEYGYHILTAYSDYYHSHRYHGSRVVDRETENTGTANARAGAWSRASINLIAAFGGRASFYYSITGYDN